MASSGTAATDWDRLSPGISDEATKAKQQAFLKFLSEHNIKTDDYGTGFNWVGGSGGDFDKMAQRQKEFASLKSQFAGQYDADQLAQQQQQAAAQMPQTTYNFQGDVSTPGLMEQYAQQSLQGFGSQPSALGDYWNETKAKFAPPGQGDQYWNQVQGGLQGAKNMPNNSQDAYNQAQGLSANTDPYYDYAVDRATREVNSAAAGRGMLNSSGSLQQVADMEANLRGQQAQANAGYGLQRAGLMGQLGTAADTSARSNSQNQLSWLQGAQQYQYQPLLYGAQVAGQVDQNSLTHLLGGAQVASQGQNALQNRAQGYFNNQMGMAGAQAGWLGQVYGGANSAEQNAWEQSQQGNLAAAKEHLTAGQNQGQQMQQGLMNGLQLYSMGQKGSGGGGGGTSGAPAAPAAWTSSTPYGNPVTGQPTIGKF